MQIEIKTLDEELLYFSLKGVTTAMANGFRRIILAEVPTFAIGDVLIEKNTSIHTNEYIIQRLGLLPIDSNNRNLISKMPVECNCLSKVCDQCAIIVDIDITSDLHKKRIFTCDFNCNIKFTKDTTDLPVLVLNAGEQFKGKLIIRKGIGHQDARFQPACAVIVKPTPNISLHAITSNENLKKLVTKCPKKIFSFSDKTGQFSIKNTELCIYCEECTKFAIDELKLPDLVVVKPIKEEFLFTIESVGTLRPDAIFLEAVAIMKSKIHELNSLPGTI